MSSISLIQPDRDLFSWPQYWAACFGPAPLQRQNCLVMVASHDYELTVLLEGTYENYHFTERIGEDDIYFDYRLYPGAVTFGNAIKLLKFMKFPEEIVTEAKQQVTMELADLQ